MATGLSKRRQQILEFIEHHTASKGYPPTVREIGSAVKLNSPSTVHAHLRRLQEEGYIERDGALTRAIMSKRTQRALTNTVQVPIVGRVAAGSPILADQDIEGYFGVPSDMAPEGQAFLLQVKGESMIGDGIRHGDYVLVRRQTSADDGDIVVALVDGGDSTVKRIYREQGRVRLQPANDEHQPIYTDNVEVVGKVVGLFRRLN